MIARGSSIASASESADINEKTGLAWKGKSEMVMRIYELRDSALTVNPVNKIWCMQQLKAIADGALTDKKFAEATKAVELTYKILSLDRDLAGQSATPQSAGAGTAITVSDKDLLKRLRASRPAEEEPLELDDASELEELELDPEPEESEA